MQVTTFRSIDDGILLIIHAGRALFVARWNSGEGIPVGMQTKQVNYMGQRMRLSLEAVENMGTWSVYNAQLPKLTVVCTRLIVLSLRGQNSNDWCSMVTFLSSHFHLPDTCIEKL